MQLELKTYKKNFEYSYTLGAFPTIEMINSRPDKVIKVILSSRYSEEFDIVGLCKRNHIAVEVNDKVINRLSPKGNCYVIGVFKKYELTIDPQCPHVVLVNPSNMGNLGTIIRSLVGFGIQNLAIIRPGVDYFDPKVIRASMGSIFRINFQYYDSFEGYSSAFNHHKIYTFMLDAKEYLHNIKPAKNELYSLVFGNEASGLDEEFLNIGTSVKIYHNSQIDSLNLPLAVGIAAYEFSLK